MKKIFKILAIIVVIVVLVCLVRDLILKSVIGTVASSVLGAPVKIGGFSLGIIAQTVKIRDLRVYNPPGFPNEVLLDIFKISVALDARAIMGGKLHMKLLDIEIKELVMTRNKEGSLNVDSLKVTEEKPREKEKKPKKEMPMRIDMLNLAMGRVVSKDYSVLKGPSIKAQEINIKKSYKNISSAQQLAVLILSEPLKHAGIKGLKMYGAMALTGVAILPVTAAFTLTGKDYSRVTLDMDMEHAYQAGLRALRESGSVLSENKAAEAIKARVDGANVIFKLKKISVNKTEVTVSARKFGLPKPEVASVIIYKMTGE